MLENEIHASRFTPLIHENDGMRLSFAIGPTDNGSPSFRERGTVASDRTARRALTRRSPLRIRGATPPVSHSAAESRPNDGTKRVTAPPKSHLSPAPR